MYSTRIAIETLIPPQFVLQALDDNGDGTATPKKIMKTAKLADHDGMVKASWGNLEYTKGNDYIVKHGPGDYGVVKTDIFAKTYDKSKERK